MLPILSKKLLPYCLQNDAIWLSWYVASCCRIVGNILEKSGISSHSVAHMDCYVTIPVQNFKILGQISKFFDAMFNIYNWGTQWTPSWKWYLTDISGKMVAANIKWVLNVSKTNNPPFHLPFVLLTTSHIILLGKPRLQRWNVRFTT